MRTVVVTIDVEPDYPPILGDSRIGVEEALPRIFYLLRSEGIPANVFLLADLCNFYPSLAKEIVDKGFHLGNHGLRHRLLCIEEMPTQWREVRESSRMLEETSGRTMSTFRAPNFSVDGDTLMCLERANYHIDSSVLPGRKLRRGLLGHAYDFTGAPTSPYHASVAGAKKHGASPVLEIPVTENPLARQTPIGGGFLNTYGSDKAMEAVRLAEGAVVVLVFHPWEFVNLSEKHPKLPSWTRAGCRDNFQALSEFLGKLKADGCKFSTLEEIAESYQKIHAEKTSTAL